MILLDSTLALEVFLDALEQLGLSNFDLFLTSMTLILTEGATWVEMVSLVPGFLSCLHV